jgi:hypothetical protein
VIPPLCVAAKGVSDASERAAADGSDGHVPGPSRPDHRLWPFDQGEVIAALTAAPILTAPLAKCKRPIWAAY